MPAWFAVDAHLEDHPKFHAFRLACNISPLEALGVIYRLWRLARLMRPDGVLSGYDPQTLESALGCSGTVRELIRTGLIDEHDGTMRVHDWSEYNGRFLKDAQRMRRIRVKDNKIATPNRSRTVREQSALSGAVAVAVHKEKNQRLSSPNGDAHALAFFQVWQRYPHYGRRSSKAKSAARWQALRPRPEVEIVLAGLDACSKSDDWTREGGRFVPAMEVWIGRRGWDSSNGIENGSPADPLARTRQLLAEKEAEIAANRGR